MAVSDHRRPRLNPQLSGIAAAGLLALCAATGPLTSAGRGAAADPAKPNGAAAAPKGNKQQKIRISTETTRLTGPLTADGDVDYVAAIDQRMRTGVTPENNAAILFWQAIGPQSIDEKVRTEFLKRLGLALPAQGDYLVAMKDFYEKLPEYEPKRPGEDWKAHDKRLKPWGEVMQRPWTADEFPPVARWLEVNARPLQRVASGAQRPNFYEPCIAGDGRSLGQVFVAGKSYREIIRALNCRINLKIGTGDVDGAWSDIQTLYNLAARLHSNDLVYALMGLSAEGMARDRIADLAHSGKLIPQQARQWENKLSELPLLVWTSTHEGELWLYPYLQNTVQLAQRKPVGEGEQKFYFPVSLALLVEREAVDFNQLLTMSLAEYDAVVVGTRKLNRQQRKTLYDQWKRDAAAVFGFALPEGPFTSVADATKVAKAISAAATPQEKERRLREVLRMFFADLPMDGVREAHTRGILNRQLARVVLLLAAYRAEQGKYPDKLADVGADEALLNDPFTGQPLHFERKGDGYALFSPGPDGELHYGTKKHASYPRDHRDDVVVLTPEIRKAEQADP